MSRFISILFQSRLAISSARGSWPLGSHAFASQADEAPSGPTGVFVKKKDGKRDKKAEGSGLNPKVQRVLEMLMPPSQQAGPGGPPKRSRKDQEEYDRRCKEFEEKKALEQEAWVAASNERLKLARAALKALPPDLRAKAEVPDMSYFPPNREYLFHTAPSTYDNSASNEGKVLSKNLKSKKS